MNKTNAIHRLLNKSEKIDASKNIDIFFNAPAADLIAEDKGIQIKSGHARFQMMNARYRSTSQALGRAARTISQYLGDDIASFTVEFIEADMVVFSGKIERADLERYALSADPSRAILDKIEFDCQLPIFLKYEGLD